MAEVAYLFFNLGLVTALVIVALLNLDRRLFAWGIKAMVKRNIERHRG